MPRASAISSLIFEAGSMPPWPGLAPWLSLISIILICGSCAVSATGHGEYFIRAAVAHDICARAAYGGGAVADAARTVVLERLHNVLSLG